MDNHNYLSEEKSLKSENDFLKMKLMLEHSADFYVPEENRNELLPDVENVFLNHIAEWGKQFAEHKTTTVYERICKPQHFRPASEIEDDKIEEQWRELSQYMSQYGIDLSACSPKIMVRELYRFTTEELFYEEMNDIFIPGMIRSFIYDEFYPDYEYNNTRYAVDDCIKPILRKESLTFTPWYAKDNISLNKYTDLTEEGLKELVNAFKDRHDDIDLQEIKEVVCNLEEKKCTVTGTHETILDFGNAHANVTGTWRVVFVWVDGFWNVLEVEIENVGF